MVENRKTSARGFASMNAEKQREIARKGGRSVPNEKRSFSQNHQLASEAGRKGGHSSHGSRRSPDSEDAATTPHPTEV
ncbi:general stress protein [Methyloferula stellata]|uniref:general stress protein n=1 Tax=Methyloferula stellata TaxID=876270 RepID=UPI0005916945|nr:general stress protein [Methyloferula stellata]